MFGERVEGQNHHLGQPDQNIRPPGMVGHHDPESPDE